MNSYKIIIEDKALKLVENVSKNRESAKVLSEISLLKEYFSIEACRAAKEFLEKEIKNFSIAAENSGPFGFLKPANFRSEFVTKISLLNNFLSVMKNRGALIKNVPGGKAVSFSIKDLSSLAKRFGDQVLRYKDNEKRDHVNKNFALLIDTKEKLIEKQKVLAEYKKEKEDIENEVLNIVNTKLTQKGSQIINEMEISKKNLKEIKENAAELEKTVKSRITSEYQQKLDIKLEELRSIKEKFINYQSEVSEDYNTNILNLKIENSPNFRRLKAINEKPTGKPEVKETKSRVIKLQEGLRKMRKKLQ